MQKVLTAKVYLVESCLRMKVVSKPHLEGWLELRTHYLTNVRGTRIWKFSYTVLPLEPACHTSKQKAARKFWMPPWFMWETLSPIGWPQ